MNAAAKGPAVAAAAPKSTLKFIPVKQLQIAPDNIRKTRASKTEDQELKASIRAKGVIQALIVKPAGKDKFNVYAGGRRLEQTQALIKEKALLVTHTLACVVVDKNTNTTEISIIENTLQARMHPVDEFEAFSKLHNEDGLDVQEIALHFGRSAQNIYQVLALGNVHPQLRALCRDGTLEVGVLSAYASTSDQKKQLEVYNALKKKGSWALNRKDEVRDLINKNCYKSNDKLAKFIDVGNYELRGGEASTDLFANVKYLHSIPLVEKMVKEKLDAAIETLSKEWKWAEIDLEYSQYHRKYGEQEAQVVVSSENKKEIARLQALLKKYSTELSRLQNSNADADLTNDQEERLEMQENELHHLINETRGSIQTIERDSKQYSEKQRNSAGCIVTISDCGQLTIYKGLIRKADKPSSKTTKSGKKDNSTTGNAPEEQAVSAALAQDLSAWHLAAGKTELLYNVDLMYQAMQFAICWEIFNKDGDATLHISLRPDQSFRDSSFTDIKKSQMHKELDDQGRKLNLSWIRDTTAESFPLFQQLDEKDIKHLLAYAATVTLQAKGFGASASGDEEKPFIDVLLQQANARLAKHWRPNAENFFARCSRPMLDAAGTAMLGANFLVESKKNKRPVINGMLGGQTEPEKATFHKCWMPPGFLYHDRNAEG